MKKTSIVLFLSLAILVLGASIPVFALIKVTTNVNCSLAPNGQANNACRTGFSGSDALTNQPYLSTTNPSGSTICVGYIAPSGAYTCAYITAGNGGANSPGGSYACLYANPNSFTVAITGVCTTYYN